MIHDVCLCVPCSVLSALVIIVAMQCCNFGAQSNNRLHDVVSLKVLEHDEEHKQVHETYLVTTVCGCKQSNVEWRSLRFIHLVGST